MEKQIRSPLLEKESLNRDIEMSEYTKSEANQGLKAIKCYNCQEELSYTPDAYCVQCHKCFGITAVRELSCLLCYFCGTNIFYPLGSSAIKCRCGKVHKCPDV